MRVLWLSHFLLHPETGFGALQRSRNLLRHVAQAAEVHHLSLITPEQASNAALMAEAKEKLGAFCASVSFVVRESGKAKLLARSVARREPYSVTLYRSDAFGRAVQALLRQTPCDIVHADTLGVLEPDHRWCSLPTVLNHHNVESAMMERRAKRERRPAVKWFLKRESALLRDYERRCGAAFTHHLCVSPEDARELARVAGVESSRISIIENPVDTDYFAPPAQDAPRLDELLFMGGMDWYPNRDAITTFLETVWPDLSVELPNLQLTVVGKDAGMAAAEPRWGGRVRFAGFVPDVRPYLHRSLAFICPMLDGGGTRLKIVDALASGVPVISTRLGCEGLAVRDREEVLFAESPSEWRGAITTVRSDRALWQRLSSQGRKLIDSTYSVQNVGARLLSAYEQLVHAAHS